MQSVAFYLVFYIIIILGVLTQTDGKLSRIRVPINHGCLDGRKYGLFHKKDVSVCRGSWEGHVSRAALCGDGWHVCNWNDTAQLSSFSYYHASHIDGCYAINAAQNGRICEECKDDKHKMAGIGADCPTMNPDIDSCLRSGTIIASYSVPGLEYQSCSFAPWLSGVVCCKDKPKGSPPAITLSPTPTVRVPDGSNVTLKCSSTGNPTPSITWFKNGYPVVFDGLVDAILMTGNKVVSSLTISQSSMEQNGLYLCRAKNSYGIAVSYSSEVTSYRLTPDLSACRNRKKQVLLFGGTVAACTGRWRGRITSASKQLCAKGWKVCGQKNRNVIHKLSWSDVTSLAGCYAYDAATSDNFACTRCSHRKKGNRMAGIGSECNSIDIEGVSCLGTGRIDVWGSEMKKRSRKFNSCAYEKRVTSGVMCCKETEKIRKRRRDRHCSPACGPNSYCSRRRVCKCKPHFKMLRGQCHPRKQKSDKCSKVTCFNGGRCKKGKCLCPPTFYGAYCQRGVILSWLSLLFPPQKNLTALFMSV